MSSIISLMNLDIHDSKSITAKAVVNVGAGSALMLIRSNDNIDIQVTNITYEIIADAEQGSESVTVYNHVRWNGDFHVVEITIYKSIEWISPAHPDQSKLFQLDYNYL